MQTSRRFCLFPSILFIRINRLPFAVIPADVSVSLLISTTKTRTHQHTHTNTHTPTNEPTNQPTPTLHNTPSKQTKTHFPVRPPSPSWRPTRHGLPRAAARAALPPGLLRPPRPLRRPQRRPPQALAPTLPSPAGAGAGAGLRRRASTPLPALRTSTTSWRSRTPSSPRPPARRPWASRRTAGPGSTRRCPGATTSPRNPSSARSRPAVVRDAATAACRTSMSSRASMAARRLGSPAARRALSRPLVGVGTSPRRSCSSSTRIVSRRPRRCRCSTSRL